MSIEVVSKVAAETPAQQKSKFTLNTFVIATGWIVLIGVCLVILGGTIYFIWEEKLDATILRDWGNLALGFLFGSFVTIMKDFFGNKE